MLAHGIAVMCYSLDLGEVRIIVGKSCARIPQRSAPCYPMASCGFLLSAGRDPGSLGGHPCMQCQGGQRLQSPAERAGSAARRCTDPRSRGLLPPLAGAGRKRARRRGRRRKRKRACWVSHAVSFGSISNDFCNVSEGQVSDWLCRPSHIPGRGCCAHKLYRDELVAAAKSHLRNDRRRHRGRRGADT